MKGFIFRIGRSLSLCFMVLFSTVFMSSGQVYANSSEETQVTQTMSTPNGEVIVYVKQSEEWVELGSLAFNRFVTENTLTLENVVSDLPVTLKLVKQGGGNAHLDSVFLGDEAPFEVNGDTEFSVKKLATKDQDLIDIDETGVVMTFPVGASDSSLKVAARIEAEHISKTPLQFPLSNMHKAITADSDFYTYSMNSKRGSLVMDGVLDEISSTKPFFKEYTIPASGHPSNDTYGWVWNDDNNLYVNIEFTPDNTMDDDKDYAKVYILTDSGVKEFKVSVPETTWGQPFFTYTDKVGYQHKVYEFQIPFASIGLKEDQTELSLAFSAYGTAAAWGITTTADNDTEVGLDGRDISVDWNHAYNDDVDFFKIYILPTDITLGEGNVNEGPNPYQSIEVLDEPAGNEFSWTGTADITTDSTGVPLQSGDYNVYIELRLLSSGYSNLNSSSITLTYELPGGDGTSEAEAYEISTPEQLNEVRNHLWSHFKLIADIDLTDYLSASGAGYNGGAGWVPIGNGTSAFSGTFEGNGHTISGLMINKASLIYAGLFGEAAENSTIGNVGLADLMVNGQHNVGGLVGYNYATITNSYVTGSVTGAGWDIGGLVGWNSGTISNSYAKGDVTAGFGEVGGLAGGNDGTISNSYATGSVTGQEYVGGLVGNDYATISNSYATGAVSGTNEVGGLIGGFTNDAYIISNSFYNSETTGQTGDGEGYFGKTTTEMRSQSTYTDWDFINIWKIDTSGNDQLHNNGYPYLRAVQSYVTYNGNGNTGGMVSFDSNSYFPGVTDTVNVLGQGDLTKPGYAFSGWNTTGTVSETVYGAGESFTITEDTTLYAVWTINQYTVSYNGIGSTGGTEPTQVSQNYNTDTTVSGNTGNLVKEGYSFAGWNTAADGSGTSHPAGSSFTIPALDKTLYAQWLSSNAMLGGLSVSQGTLDFVSSDLNYTVDVDNEVTSLDVFITKGDPIQTMTVTGAVYQTVTGSVYHYQASNLNVGANPIQIQVSAQDGTQNEYSLTIQRISNNADLDGLALSEGTISPTFSSSTDEYTARVLNSVSSLTVTASVADSTAAMTVNGIAVTSGTESGSINLNVGSNSIPVVVTAQDATTAKTYTITVTRAAAPSSGGGGEPTGGTDETNPTDQNETDLIVTIDGETEQAIATTSTSEQDGQTIVTATIDTAKLKVQLEQAGDKPVVAIPVIAEADKVTAVLSGDAIQAMQDKHAVLDIQTQIGSYKLPASEVKVDLLAMLLGGQDNQSELTVHVDIAKSDDTKVGLLWDAANLGNFTVVVPPVDFTVTATLGDKSVTVDTFSSFVEREIPIPDGVDASKITTAVVLNEDGTTRSVPMKIVTRDGKSYAVINSLTNSTYSLVSYPIAFKDVENHWSKDAVNEMGSRMVINGTGNGMFSPGQDITRAEFAAIIVRGLGLKLETGPTTFTDVKTSDWYNDVIKTAYAYDLINGFDDGTFRPNDKITREQAMVIISKAMVITKLSDSLSNSSTDATLRSYQDETEISAWALHGIADTVQAGIVSGRSSTELAPKDNMTRAEVAVIIKRLLKKSDLI